MSEKKDEPQRPTASQFFDPLVKVLGELVDYEAGKGVPYKDALDLVLKEAGIDPDNSPWPLKGYKPVGLYRIIGFAYRNQRPNLKSSRYSGQRPAMCLTLDRGYWGLTEAGVERAKELKDTSVAIFSRGELGIAPREEEPASDLISEKDRSDQDTRDDQTWVVVELTKAGETKIEEGSLDESLRRDLDIGDEHPIFIPAMTYTRGDKVTPILLMEGYVFIATGLPEVSYFSLEKQPYINQVMSVEDPHGMRVLSTIPNGSIEDMKNQLRNMSVLELDPGEKVKVVEGKYSGLEMKFLMEDRDGPDEDYVILKTVGLRSLSAVVRLPRAFLELVEEDY